METRERGYGAGLGPGAGENEREQRRAVRGAGERKYWRGLPP
jgi:hypothetical protein